MKIINPNASLINPPDNKLRLVERIGRTCYKSEDLITEDSYLKFCNGLLKREHYAMLEHAVFTFEIKGDLYAEVIAMVHSQEKGYRHFICDEFTDEIGSLNFEGALVSANLRAIIESEDDTLIYLLTNKYPYLSALLGDKFDLKYVDISQEGQIHFYDTYKEVINAYRDKKEFYGFDDYVIKRHIFFTSYIVCDRGITHELVRHRPCSFAQSSTRYCNYSKGKFGNEITVVKPCFFSENNNDTTYWFWKDACEKAERAYIVLLNEGATPEQARSVLPTSISAEIWITASAEEWTHIFDLRARGTTGKPHPQMVEIMKPLANQFAHLLPEYFYEVK